MTQESSSSLVTIFLTYSSIKTRLSHAASVETLGTYLEGKGDGSLFMGGTEGDQLSLTEYQRGTAKNELHMRGIIRIRQSLWRGCLS